MIGPGLLSPISIYNTTGFAYLSATKRIAINPDTGNQTSEELIDGIWQPASLETGPNSLWVGVNVGLAGVGHHLATEAADGHLHLHAHNEFDQITGLTNADTQIVDSYAYIEKSILQGDNSGTWTGTEQTFQIVSPAHLLANNGYLQTDSIAATVPVRYRIYHGADDTGTIIFDQVYPASEFPAATEVKFVARGYIEFETGDTYFHKITSDANISFKMDVTNTTPWFASDISFLREDNLLQTKPWISGDSWTAGDYFIDSRKIYVCNTTGVQTGTFAENSSKWDLLSSAANDYWTKAGSALTYNDGSRNRVLIDTDGFKIYDNASVDRFFIGDTFSQLRGETDAVGSRVLVSDISAALMHGTGHIKILDNAIQMNDTNRTRLDIDSSKIRLTAATGAGYLQMTDESLLYEDGNKDRLDITPLITTIHDEPDTGGGYLSLQSKEFTFVDGTVARIFTDALETTLVSPDNGTVVRVTDDGVKGVMTAAFTGGLPDSNVPRRIPFGDAGTTGLGPAMPLSGRVIYLTLSTRLNNTLDVTLRKNDVDTLDTVSLSAEQTKVTSASTTFEAGDRLCLFKEGTTQADALIATFAVEFDD